MYVAISVLKVGWMTQIMWITCMGHLHDGSSGSHPLTNYIITGQITSTGALVITLTPLV